MTPKQAPSAIAAPDASAGGADPAGAQPPASSAATIARNSAWLVGTNILGKFISVFFYAYAANRLGAESYGLYGILISFTTFFNAMLDLGYMTLMIERGSKDRSQLLEHYHGNLGLKLILYPLGLPVFLAACALVYPLDAHLTAAFVLAYLLLVTYSHQYLLRGVLQAVEDLRPYGISELVERLFLFSVGVGVLVASGSLFAFMLVLLAAAVLKIAYLQVAVSRRNIPTRFRVDPAYIRTWFLLALPHSIYSLAGSVNYRVDQVMLGAFQGESENALYLVAFDKVWGLAMLGTLLATAIMPTASRNFAHNPAEFQRIFRRAFYVLVLAGLPMSVGLGLCAQPIIRLLHTDEFQPGGIALAILSAYIVLRFLIALYMAVLVGAGRIADHVRAELIALALKLVANVWLLPEYGYVAAAFSTVLSDVVVLVLDAFYARRIGLPFLPLLHAWEPIAASAVMGVLVWVAAPLGLAGQIAVGAVVYPALCLMLRVDRKEPGLVHLMQRLRGRFAPKAPRN